MRLTNILTGIAATAGAAFAATGAFAQAVNQELQIVGAPTAGGMGFQEAASEIARDGRWLDNMVLMIVSAITIFVVLLLLFVIVRFNSRANPTPAKFTHNSPLEIAWTIGPILILVFIGAFALPTLFKQQVFPEGDIVVKVTGHQWYWSYEYPDEAVAFDSYMIGAGQGNLNPEISAELAAAGYTDAEFLLAADNALVLPVGKTILLQVTGADVIHAFMVPSFEVHISAVPGRLNQAWFNTEKEGIFFGQCSTLCGQAHAYMPITVKVVSQEAYDAWLAAAKVENPA